ncbi:MAG: EAL domain-containing protein [Pseudohongiellaceae bacterium]
MPLDSHAQKNSATPTLPPELDPLTGFHQQIYLDTALQQTIEKNQQQGVAASLALLQLENFYEIKTWLGKSEATLFLSDIARLIKKSLPPSVLLCRCQRFEFAALLFDQSNQNIRSMADKVQKAIEIAAKDFLPAKLRLNIVIGIAAMEKRISSVEVMYAKARQDMQLETRTLSPQVNCISSLDSGALVGRLKTALESGCLTPQFQAIISLKSDHFHHYEIRTQLEDDQGLIPAGLLFEKAVQFGWGESLDRWLIKNGIKILHQTRRSDLKLVLNLTHDSIVSPRFFPWLETLLIRAPVARGKLVFQLSEIDILIAQGSINHFCENLKTLEIQLSINHFGCTDNPFSYLDEIRAEFVRLDGVRLNKTMIDQSNTESLGRTEDLEGFVEKLHEHGLRVIVSKVESMTTMPKLWRSNVNFVQGFGLHRPSKTLDYEFLQESTLQLH